MDAKTILVVEDQATIRALVKDTLEAAGYRVLEADTVAVGLHLFRTQKPDLALVDLELPDGSGLDVCRGIRSSADRRATPVVILTAKARLEDKEQGFSTGADQYLVKPVPPKELTLWVEALLRRLAFDRDEGPLLEAGDCVIDSAAHLVRYKGEPIANLTAKEFDLFRFLVRKRPQVLSRKFILTHLWHTVAVDQLVDTHMSNIRRKLPRELSDRLQTVPGKGFRYFDER